MSIKKMKGYYKVLFSPRNFLDLEKKTLYVSLSTSNDIYWESFKWVKYSLLKAGHVSFTSQDLWEEKNSKTFVLCGGRDPIFFNIKKIG